MKKYTLLLFLFTLLSEVAFANEKSFQLEIDTLKNRVEVTDRHFTNWEHKYKAYKQKIAVIINNAKHSGFLSDRYYAYFQVVKGQALMLKDLANDYLIIKHELKQVQQHNEHIREALVYYQQPLLERTLKGESNMIHAGLQFNQNKRHEAAVLLTLINRLAEVNKLSLEKERRLASMEKKLKSRKKQMLALKRRVKSEIKELRESTTT